MLDLYSLVPVALGVALETAGALAQVAPVSGGGPAPAAPAAGGSSSSPASSGGSGILLQLAFPILIFVAFYLFLIRPQQKKQKDLDTKLKKGDTVFTNSGIVGKIVELGDRRVTLEVSRGVNMVFLRTAIGGIDEGDPAKTESDAKAAEKRA
jgi:preprotein translocase subunit YajC